MKLAVIVTGLCGILIATNLFAKTAVANQDYTKYVISGKEIYIGGQYPQQNGELKFSGKLGSTISIADGKKAAQLATENILKLLTAAAVSLDKIERCVKINVFINTTPDFTEHKAIARVVDDVLTAALGNRGLHARTTIGVNSLPSNTPIVIDAICTLR